MFNNLLFVWIIFINASAQYNTKNHKELYSIIEDFRTLVINQNDEQKFSDLFLHESITWSAIVAGKSKEKISAQKPNFKFTESNFNKFYNSLKKGDEEKFYNIKIDVRNDFSTISFDYSFNRNGKVENWGTEYWSLMFVNNKWKITSVTWSMIFEEDEKCPFDPKKRFCFNIKIGLN